MSQLEEDIAKLADDVITKKDIKAAFEILAEVTGAVALCTIAIMAIFVWIPGLGIPLSASVAAKFFTMMKNEYVNLPADKRRVIAKCAKWLLQIIN